MSVRQGTWRSHVGWAVFVSVAAGYLSANASSTLARVSASQQLSPATSRPGRVPRTRERSFRRHDKRVRSPDHDRGNRQVDCLSTAAKKGARRCFPRFGPTQSLPKPTRSRNPYNHLRGGRKDGAAASYLALAWRTGTATWRSPLTTDELWRSCRRRWSTTCDGRYQLLRAPVSGYADEHAAMLAPRHRHDPCKP